jgi:hypothetical protein
MFGLLVGAHQIMSLNPDGGRALSDYEIWCREKGCQHAHCPCYCDHPQPFLHDGKLVCGECAIVDGNFCEMIPCYPETCE